jgi:phospholipase C
VPKADVLPYYDIASKYGFANYFFQTNEGPSFPAHQFLFAGTSAPVPYLDSSGHWKWFAAENPEPTGSGDDTGCTAPTTEYVQLIDNDNSEGSCPGSDPHCSFPCYERNPSTTTFTWGSLADVLGAQTPPIGWEYYTPEMHTVPGTNTIEGGLWVAPIAIKHFCQPGTYMNVNECLGLLVEGQTQGQYYANMRYETAPHPFPLYDDITACKLAAVSWAIPDAKWSDHASEARTMARDRSMWRTS